MDLKSSVQAGREKARQALEKRSARSLSKSMNARRFEHVFNSYYVAHGHGTSLPLTKQDWGMLKNFIKLLKENGWEDEEIRNLAVSLVREWSTVAGKEMQTNRFRTIILPQRPSIRAFLICSNEIVSGIYRESVNG